MTGILLIVVALIWLISVAFAIWCIVKSFESTTAIMLSIFVLGPLLFFLPLIDEIVGAFQFDALCKKLAVQIVDEENARDKSVVFVSEPTIFASRTAVRIRIEPNIYRDVITDKVLVSYNTLHANGGWLIRALGISNNNSPLLFSSGCSPKDELQFKAKFNITVLN